MNNIKYYVNVDENNELVSNAIYTATSIAATLQMDFDESFIVPDDYKELTFETIDDVTLTKYQRLSDEISISKEDGKWYKKAIVVDGDEAYRTFVDGQLNTDARNVRLMKLYQSDWTQVSDSPLSAEKKEEWKAYRQALRDITSDPAFPSHHKWPIEPQ